jgi:hypothetical protein
MLWIISSAIGGYVASIYTWPKAKNSVEWMKVKFQALKEKL